jgi:23S rRNA (pseudouridine1915-N3)-methyltransferase
MKFSDIKQEQWAELKPYLDTIVLPVTGLTGSEEPWQATHQLEQLRDLLDSIEEPFRGRVVIYPAFHYISDMKPEDQLRLLSEQLRTIGFNYVIIAQRVHTGLQEDNPFYDLLLTYADYIDWSIGEMKKDVRGKIVSLWDANREASNM